MRDMDIVHGVIEPVAITKELIEERVRDWKDRLYGLFQDIQSWAVKHDWHVDAERTMAMDEELMQEFDVSPTRQPMLRLEKDESYALFKPKGLWVIGANGRIDLYTSAGTFVIVDLAEQGTAPQWTIFRASRKREGDLFTPEMIPTLV